MPDIKYPIAVPPVLSYYTQPPYEILFDPVLTLAFRTTSEAARRLVPEPLVPSEDNLVVLWAGRLRLASPKVDYLEIGLGVPSSMQKTSGNYASVLYLDSAIAIVTGRETAGWPKKDAEITLEEDGGSFRIVAVRDGVPIIEVMADLSSKRPGDLAEPDSSWFALKCVPSVRRGDPPDLMRLTRSQVTTEVNESSHVNCNVVLRSAPNDPLGDVPVLETVDAVYQRKHVILHEGEVVFDYLAENPSNQ